MFYEVLIKNFTDVTFKIFVKASSPIKALEAAKELLDPNGDSGYEISIGQEEHFEVLTR